MSPTFPPPEPGDLDMWGQIVRAGQQLLYNGILWSQLNTPLLTLAALSAWLFGVNKGLHGRSLRIVVFSGMLFAYVFTPIALHYFGLVEELWKSAIVVFLSVSTWRIIKWMEMIALRNMGIERRKSEEE